MRRSAPLLLLAGALALTGCYKMNIDARALEPAVYINAGDTATPPTVAEFETETIASWLLWGLVDLREPDIEAELRREIERANGSAVTNLEITTKTTFVNGFLRVITLGIYGQRTTVLTGSVVR